VLRKNKNFDVRGILRGNVDTIEGLIIGNASTKTQDVIRGELDYVTEDPAGELLPEVRSKYPIVFARTPTRPISTSSPSM
jgi:hypothetical protein